MSGNDRLSAADTDLEPRLRAALSPAYQLVRQLGAGGMGTVWLAREPALRRDVAVKVLAPELVADTESRARFEREAQAVAAFSHPNVVGIHGLGALADGTPYFVMQFVGGQSLAARVEADGPLPVPEARRVIGEVAAALAAAHAKGIIHRDIKPANVLYDAESGRALVSDFGISAVQAGEGAKDAKLTQTGAVIGTPKYMSPEALLAEPVTDKTDVYALGLLAYELVVGEGPFKETAPQALMAAHLRDVPARLSSKRAEVDPELDEVVAACMAKDPAARPTAAAVARRFAPGADTLLEWPPPGLDPFAGKLWAFARNAGRASVMIIIGVLAFIVVGYLGASRFTPGLGFIGTMLVVIGSLSWVRWSFALARDLLRAGQAVQHGYSWLTIGEVAADDRRDTGAIIAGSREYAGLDGATRSLLRRRRLSAAITAAVAAAIVPLMILLVAVLAAGEPTSLWWPIALLIGVPFAFLFASTAMMETERRRTADSRRRIDARHRESQQFSRLVGPWQQSFDLVRGEQGLGRGHPGRRVVARAGAVAGVALILLLSWWLFPLLVIGYGSALPPRTEFNEARSAKRYQRVIELLSTWAPPLDSSITPLAAGESSWTLAGLVITPTAMHAGLRPFPSESPVTDLPPDGMRVEESRFGSTVWGEGGARIRVDSALVVGALRGEMPYSRGWHDSLEAHPLWSHWTKLSRATSIDGIGARVLPGAFDADPLDPPGSVWIAHAADRTAQLNHARVAGLLAGGRAREAVDALREEVGFWRAHATEAYPSIVPIGAGRSMERALDGALLILERTGIGRPGEVSRLRRDLDAARAIIDDRIVGDTMPSNAALRFAAYARDLRDPAIPLAHRFRALGLLAVERCESVRGALFGHEPRVREIFAYARDSLARWPSEVAYVDWLDRSSPRDFMPNSILPDGVGVCGVYSIMRF